MTGQDENGTSEEVLEVEPAEVLKDAAPAADTVEGDGGELNMEKKKKKKKKPAADMEAGGEDGAGEEDLSAGLADLSLAKKKKKKKPKERAPDEQGDEAAGAQEDVPGGESTEAAGPRYPWDNTDRDYLYEELLDRVFGILRENNPELTGEKRRTVMKPPLVAREGTKKTVFTNFPELCKSLNRQYDHVMAFVLAELGTSGNLDGENRLIVKGRFLPKGFEAVLRRYANEYVLCSSCKSPDTLLDRDSASRINFLRCQQCGASRTVATIKAGFVARTSRRVKTG